MFTSNKLAYIVSVVISIYTVSLLVTFYDPARHREQIHQTKCFIYDLFKSIPYNFQICRFSLIPKSFFFFRIIIYISSSILKCVAIGHPAKRHLTAI